MIRSVSRFIQKVQAACHIYLSCSLFVVLTSTGLHINYTLLLNHKPLIMYLIYLKLIVKRLRSENIGCLPHARMNIHCQLKVFEILEAMFYYSLFIKHFVEHITLSLSHDNRNPNRCFIKDRDTWRL